MDYKIVSFADVCDHVMIPPRCFDRLSQMDADEINAARRKDIFHPEGFLEQLRGLPLEEQMTYYGIAQNCCYSRSSYGEVSAERNQRTSFSLAGYAELAALIVEDDILIGVCIFLNGRDGMWEAPLFPYQKLCTYSASDNNGAGTSDREDYVCLFCIKK